MKRIQVYKRKSAIRVDFFVIQHKLSLDKLFLISGEIPSKGSMGNILARRVI